MMEARYDPQGLEERWQRLWEDEGLYAAGAGARRSETFVICVSCLRTGTGDLHMGHALNGSMQDCLVRWHRMRGFDTLWQPGYDHAGISTQNVVEKQLIAEGSSRRELGRDVFLQRTWAWLETTGRTIMGQFRKLGCLDVGCLRRRARSRRRNRENRHSSGLHGPGKVIGPVPAPPRRIEIDFVVEFVRIMKSEGQMHEGPAVEDRQHGQAEMQRL